jgi:hypothetical protein
MKGISHFFSDFILIQQLELRVDPVIRLQSMTKVSMKLHQYLMMMRKKKLSRMKQKTKNRTKQECQESSVQGQAWRQNDPKTFRALRSFLDAAWCDANSAQ